MEELSSVLHGVSNEMPSIDEDLERTSSFGAKQALPPIRRSGSVTGAI